MLPRDCSRLFDNELQAAAALGQSVFAATGDFGAKDPTCTSASGLTVSYPASSSWGGRGRGDLAPARRRWLLFK